MPLNEDEKRRVRNIRKVLENQEPEDPNFLITNSTVSWLVMKLLQTDRHLVKLRERVFIDSDAKEELDRAKQLLMRSYNMTEPGAYKFITTVAMEQRITKNEVAKRILNKGRA